MAPDLENLYNSIQEKSPELADKEKENLVESRIVEPGRSRLKKMIIDWHDRIKPGYIFLTETSATPYGYLFKEVWRAAYGEESLPKFFRINPSVFVSFASGDVTPGEIENAKWQEYLEQRITDNDANIIIFDEESVRGVSPRAIREALAGKGSFGKSMTGGLKNKLNLSINRIFIVSQAPCPLPHALGSEDEEYRLITTKSGSFLSGELDGDNYKAENISFVASPQQDPDKIQKALRWIETIEKEGEEIGKELKIEFEQK